MKIRIPRAEVEPLLEEKVEVDGNTVMLHRNLGPLALTQMMSNAKAGEIKGLIVGDKIYYWDSYNATHFQIADALGVKHHVDDRLFFYRTDNGAVLMDRNQPVDHVEKPLERLMRSPNIYFYGSDGQYRAGTALAA